MELAAWMSIPWRVARRQRCARCVEKAIARASWESSLRNRWQSPGRDDRWANVKASEFGTRLNREITQRIG